MSEGKVFGTVNPEITYKEREGAYGIALKDGKVFIEKARLGYFLPGGGIDDGETIEQALVREFREETGYELTSWKLIGTAVEYREDRRNTGHYYLVELGTKGEPAYDDDHVFPVEWEPVDSVHEFLHLDAHWWAIQEAIRFQ